MFLNFLNLDKILIVLSNLLSFLTILLLLKLNIFKANILDNLVIFNIKINDIVILLKLLIKYQ